MPRHSEEAGVSDEAARSDGGAGPQAGLTGRDPLLRARKELEQAGTSAAALDEADASARADVLALTERVLARPAPDPATAWTDVWADGSGRWRN